MAARQVRLGVLIPSANLMTEPDLYRMLPTAVTVHFSRMRFRGDSPEEFRRMLDDLPNSCEALRDGDMAAYVFACTTGTMLDGRDFDAEVISTMERITNRPATTTAAAVVAAFHELRVSRVAMATPYQEWLNQKERDYLERKGIKVVALEGLGISSAVEKADQPPEKIYDLARSVDRPEAEAIFISCAGVPAVELLDRLERDLAKPVISSNQATLWKLLQMCNIRKSISGYGQLLLQH